MPAKRTNKTTTTRRGVAVPPGRPRFEVDPPARLVACLRQAFPGFTPTDVWWARVELEVKSVFWMNHRAAGDHDAFVRGYFDLTADQLVRLLQVEGMIPAPPVDEYARLADDLSPGARRMLAALLELVALKQADKIRRWDIIDQTGLTEAQVRRVMEKELPYVNPTLVKSMPGCAGGIWLTTEGKLVADCIDKKILPTPRVSTDHARNRRYLRA